MKEKTGQIFSIAQDNRPVNGCTISKAVNDQIIYFSLARDTDISAEIFPYHKFIMLMDGELEVCTREQNFKLKAGQAFISPKDIPVGMRSHESAVYAECMIRRIDNMNSAVKVGEVFGLKDLLPYQEGKIINMDVVSNDKMKFVIMSFDAGTGLSEHAAPGEAIIFALDGEGVISYEGKDHPIKAGEQFSFAKGGMHAVKADKPFKMALLLTLD